MYKHSTRITSLAPEEVLFQRKDAPARYAEEDIYMAHERDLPDGGRDVLPDSDLLKAVHSYTSHYYEALGRNAPEHYVGRRNINQQSMDETALLAFGILLEEAGREVLGKHGDLVFTEGVEASDDGGEEDNEHVDSEEEEEEDDDDADEDDDNDGDNDGNGKDAEHITRPRASASVSLDDIRSWRRNPRKKRRVDDLEQNVSTG
jgi:hypothetical protein